MVRSVRRSLREEEPKDRLLQLPITFIEMPRTNFIEQGEFEANVDDYGVHPVRLTPMRPTKTTRTRTTHHVIPTSLTAKGQGGTQPTTTSYFFDCGHLRSWRRQNASHKLGFLRLERVESRRWGASWDVGLRGSLRVALPSHRSRLPIMGVQHIALFADH
ncbi:hypothetical protein VTO42DRAFT_7969 [Malbranchea cinnamomea]